MWCNTEPELCTVSRSCCVLVVGKDCAFKSRENVYPNVRRHRKQYSQLFIMVILSVSPRVISELRVYEAGTLCGVPPTSYLSTLPRKPAISVDSPCPQNTCNQTW